MEVSALRVAACAGALAGGLVFGNTAVGLANADPDSATDGQTATGVSTEHAERGHLFRRHHPGEHRKRHRGSESNSAPTKSDTDDKSARVANESVATTFSDAAETSEPQTEPGDEREVGTDDGTDDGTEVGAQDTQIGGDAEAPESGGGFVPTGGGGIEPSVNTVDTQPEADTGGGGGDNAVVASEEPAATPAPVSTVKASPDVVEYPFLYYILEIRRDGGGWWNATQIISRIEQPAEPAEPEPDPEPTEPAPEIAVEETPEPEAGISQMPAFRGAVPQAPALEVPEAPPPDVPEAPPLDSPAPEPVLDASGGVGGAGSDYQPAEFGGESVLRAPVIVAPVLPPAAVSFPAIGSAQATGLGASPAAGRALSVESGSPSSTFNSTLRAEGTPPPASAGTVTSMAGQAPRQGYTEYLRSPGLAQVAGAALPGIAGILLMTFGGGVVGYRQANAGRVVRTTSAARYLP